ncbi:hypothetical protein [Nocardia sp. NBC_00511]|uniref:hypothetical protein n=1 Tax=Nocardia sp. NBC_00511 TaxID=2903591 RepID=UPI0030E389C3
MELRDDPAEGERQITNELAGILTDGWQRLDAVFAFTVSDEAAQVILSDGERVVPARPSARVVELLRAHRHQCAATENGPWWRLLVSLTNTGEQSITYDYGTEPFPDEQLFPAAAYLADLQVYPRKRLPVWLAAYVGHQGSQIRTPRTAFTQARADLADNIGAVPVTTLPPLSRLWARWAAISAAFVAVNSPRGPRITTAVGWFEGAKHSGATLYRLPQGRAVLSGGVWDAPELEAVYNHGGPMPRFYRGAPEWVADPVLNPRAGSGLMSFCYWWDGQGWYRGESPDPPAVRAALPGVWSARVAADVIGQVIDAEGTDAVDLVAAAESGSATRSLLVDALGTDRPELDGAYYQLLLAGVVAADSARAR